MSLQVYHSDHLYQRLLRMYNNSLLNILIASYPQSNWMELQDIRAGNTNQNKIFNYIKKYFITKQMMVNFRHPGKFIGFE